MVETVYPIFSVTGIEIEFMIVDRETLKVRPICDQVLTKLNGGLTNEVELNSIAVSNELVLHVLELKTNGPAKTTNGLDKEFAHCVKHINKLLLDNNAMLLPTGMHPFFNPDTETKLWPHDNHDIYEAYDKIFDCRGHGWSNLQSTHINLPFGNDDEFKKLHSAIRLVLPLIPALCASTPFSDNQLSGLFDTRLSHYKSNQKEFPQITGMIIPDFIEHQTDYLEKILLPMYRAIAEYDQKGILQHEWLNSRGAIARFERNAIEIRIVDSQESALADLTCVAAIIGVLKWLVYDTTLFLEKPADTVLLRTIYDSMINQGPEAPISSLEYLEQLGFNEVMTGYELWDSLLDRATKYIPDDYFKNAKNITKHGNLAHRIHKSYTHGKSVMEIYQSLAQCLAENTFYEM